MMFDGMRWVISHKVVPLPHDMWQGDSKNYVTFGRIVARNTPGAIKTTRVYRHSYPQKLWGAETQPEPDGYEDEVGRLDGKPFKVPYWFVYAKPVECDGHSLTNLMYGKDGYMYLMLKGSIYVRGPKARI